MPRPFRLPVPALALCAAAFATGAHAQSVDIRVTGTVTPPSCVPSLSNGGVVDYETIAAATLNKTEYTKLPDKNLVLSILCTDRTHVAVRAIDNRSSSLIPGIVNGLGTGWSDEYNFGLGTSGGVKVGGYGIVLVTGTYTMDGNAVSNVRSENAGSTWLTSSGAMSNWERRYYSWSTTAGGAPTAFQNLTGTLRVRAVLNKANELPLSGDVELDGSVTIELMYL